MNRSTYHRMIYMCSLLLVITSLGCKKILDIKPASNASINPHLIKDFEQIMNNQDLASPNYLTADMMNDDIMLSDKLLSTQSTSAYIKAYRGWPAVWDATEIDIMYTTTYQLILQCNIVVDRINAAPDGTRAQKNIVLAQAKINRAYYYFQLANLYGAGYNAATASQDLAVPLVLKADAALQTSRATVQQVYDLILRDLQDALNTTELPDFGTDVIHPGRAAALALQARVNLFMANYAQALASANAALKIKSTLLDYNTFSLIDGSDPSSGVLNKPLTLIDETKDPEALLVRISLDFDFYRFYVTPFISDDLQALFTHNDLRYVYNFSPPNNGARATYFLYNFSSMLFNYGIGVPEMLLTKAECLARQGDASGALVQLELIRKFRFSQADYVPLINTGAENALKQVLDERRRELFLHGGLRLFDLKRLNVDSRFKKDIVRVSDTDGHTITTLKPGDPGYLVPFSPRVLNSNPNIIQNPR